MTKLTQILMRLVTVVGVALALAAPASATTTTTTGVVSMNNVLSQPTSGSAKAWIIVIHGGGWHGGASLMAPDLMVARWYDAQGYGTYTIDYRSGRDSYFDTVAAYDWLVQDLKKQYAGGTVPPICAWGESAGGHLALLLAASRPLNCVISQAGPTDFLSWRAEATATNLTTALAAFTTLILPAWSSSLSGWSPVTYCPMKARLLLGASSGDRIVPPAQMNDFKASCTAAQTVLLDGNANDGTLVSFTHAGVTAAAKASWQSEELAFLPR